MSLPFLVFLVAWLIGMVCTFIPAVPATLIIFLGALVASVMDGFQTAQDLPLLLTLGVVTLLILSVNVASAWGARKYGGGKEAMWGALVGGLLGVFVPPIGFLVGPLLGALLAELTVAHKPFDLAVRSAWGTLVGILAGIAAKLVLHFLVGAYELWRLWNPAQSIF